VTAAHATDRPYTVIYDGNCGMCTRLVRRLSDLDKRDAFEIIPSQQEDVHARFPWIAPEAYERALQLVRRADNTTWEGSAAVEEIISRLRAGWLVSWIFAVPFGRRVADRIYRWVADHRHELGCGDHCRI
jgi:predicted DCC family thiol-disulfide oxidoreductase YuxK